MCSQNQIWEDFVSMLKDKECNLGLSQIRQFHRVRMISEGYGCLTWWDVRIGGSLLLMKWNPLEGKIILKIVRNKRSSQTSKKSEKVPTMLLSTSWLITPLISHEPVPPSPQAILNGHMRLRSQDPVNSNQTIT